MARQTVQGYVDVVCDTLIGLQLPAWTARPRVKQVEHPKFFWFDPGVVRALSGRLRAPLDAAERGALFETLILHELRAHIAYNNIGGALSYWRTPSGSEVDFIWSSAGRSVGIEVKVSDRYRPEYTRALAGLIEEKQLNAGFLVYGGTRPLRVGLVRVLPYASFLRALAAGEVIGL